MKNRSFWIVGLSLAMLPLASCGEQAPKISLYNAESRFVIKSFDDQGSVKVPTYHNSKTGDVPYSELSEFFYGAGAYAGFRTTVTKTEGGYRVTHAEGKTLLTVNPEKDTLSVENFELWAGNQGMINNGVGPDVGSSEDNPDAAIHPSEATKIHGEKKPEVYDLSKYNFDCVESDGKCYVPTQVLSNIFFRWNTEDWLYNGSDFYLASLIRFATIPVVVRSYYATTNRFLAFGKEVATLGTPQGNEAYRYTYKYNETTYHIMSLTKDGKGALLEGASPNDAGKQASIDGVIHSYAWEKKGEAIYLTDFATGKEGDGQTVTVSQGVQKIPLKDTRYGAKTRSKETADFTYDLLRFQFDHFYGLKDVAGYTDFDGYANGKGLKDRLHSLEASVYDDALAELTMKDIDDGHTRYVLPSIYSGEIVDKGNELVKKYEGPRRKGLFAKQEQNMALRKKVSGVPQNTADADLQGLFFKGSTAVIRFDEFTAQGIFVTNSRDKDEAEKTEPLSAFKLGDLPLGLDASFYRIKQHSEVKNVVLDLTCNGGGAVMAVPYILAHLSKDPKMYFSDIGMGVVKEFHYKADLNHDHVYGGEGDSYEGKYKFFVLTSGFSFSCANFTPTFAKYSGAKVIGEKSGGGACTVAGFTDGSGSVYSVSSSMVCVYPKGDTFAHTDSGVEVDAALGSDSWYDLEKLDAFVSKLNA